MWPEDADAKHKGRETSRRIAPAPLNETIGTLLDRTFLDLGYLVRAFEGRIARSVDPKKPGRVILTLGEGFRKEEECTVHDDRSVEEMAGEILMRQAKARADRSGEPIEEAVGFF